MKVDVPIFKFIIVSAKPNNKENVKDPSQNDFFSLSTPIPIANIKDVDDGGSEYG